MATCMKCGHAMSEVEYDTHVCDSPRQKARQSERNRNGGKYTKMNRCEVCDAFVGDDYCSHEDCNKGGFGLCLCDTCCTVMSGIPKELARKCFLWCAGKYDRALYGDDPDESVKDCDIDFDEKQAERGYEGVEA